MGTVTVDTGYESEPTDDLFEEPVRAYHERLSAQDASFLYAETSSTPMHVGALALFENGAIDVEGFRRHVEGRMHLLPRFRQKLAYVPYGQGRPSWVDDDHFDIRWHIRETDVDGDTDVDAHKLMGRIMSMPLSQARPLWEIWLFDLPGDRKGLIIKTHHCLVDGMSGVHLATVLFDGRRDVVPTEAKPWSPAPGPSANELLRESFTDQLRQPLALIDRLRGAYRDPDRFWTKAAEIADGVKSFATAALGGLQEKSSLRKPVGAVRRFEALRVPLDRVKEIKTRMGCKLNDVALSSVAGAVGRLLESRGEHTGNTTIKAVVPVSVRDPSQAGTYGNQVSMMTASLPVGDLDPQRRLSSVSAEMNGLKKSGQAVGAGFWLDLAEYAPAPIVHLASRVVAGQGLVDVIVTNVPGPPFPLYLLGSELLEIYPFVPLVGATALGVAIVSYNGQLHFGLSGDWDAMPDLDVIRDGIAESLDELRA